MAVMHICYMKKTQIVLTILFATAFRVDNLPLNDMEQIVAFKRIVKNSLMMDSMLLRWGDLRYRR